MVLHPEFKTVEGGETSGRRAIRKLISERLLSQYDFDNSVRFAGLLKENAVQKSHFRVGTILRRSWFYFHLDFLLFPVILVYTI